MGMIVQAVVLTVALLLSLPGLAEEYTGKVVGITDGDTLTLLTVNKRQVKVRLAEIDTPERSQPYGSRTREALSDLAFGREARLVVVDHDRYGRVVGRVHVGNTDVNAELIRQGAAWVYRDYVPAMPRCSLCRTKPAPLNAACGRCRRRNWTCFSFVESGLAPIRSAFRTERG